MFVSENGLERYDVNARTSQTVPGTTGTLSPRAVGSGDVSLLKVDQNVVTLLFVEAGGSVRVFGELSFPSWAVGFFEWTADYHAVASDSSENRLHVLEPPGRFALRGAALEPGLNTITAAATDTAGNESAPSQPIEITFDTETLADLTVDSLFVLPAMPASGQMAIVSLDVRNEGLSESADNQLQVAGSSIGQELYAIGTAAVPSLTPGATTTVHVSWDTGGRLGPQTLVAEVDPLGLVDEKNEANNTLSREVTVVGSENLEIGVATGRPSYGPAEDVQIDLQLVNGGAARNLTVETRIEDLVGNPVATVDSRELALSYGETTSYRLFWNTGTTFAGDYRVRVRALAGVEEIGRAFDEFELTRSVQLGVTVVTARASYTEGDTVELLARVTNELSNAPVRDVTLRYRILDPNALTVFETSQVISYLAVGGSFSAGTSWASGATVPGDYDVVLDVLEGNVLLASAGATFELRGASEVVLSGTVSVVEAAVAVGGDVVSRYTIDNQSVVPLVGGTVRVELYDPETQQIVRGAETALDVAPGASTSGELAIDTAGLDVGRYSVILSAGSQALEALAESAVTLFGIARVEAMREGENETAWAVSPRLEDGKTYYWQSRARDEELDGPWSPRHSFRVNVMNEEPTAPTLDSPAQNAVVAEAQPTLVVTNAVDPDGDPLTYRFEVYSDLLLLTLVEASPEIAEGVEKTSWQMSKALQENAAYYWRVRATDGRLVGPWMDTARFRFSLTNERPSPPVPLEPENGATVRERQPLLVVDNATDPENDALRYVFQVFWDADLQQLVVESPEIDEGDPRTSWRVSLELEENVTYYWRASATDGALSSEPSEVFGFFVNAVDEPPTLPTLLTPADGASVELTSPTLTVLDAVSPDGEVVHYHFALYAGPALNDVVSEDENVPEGNASSVDGQTSWEVPVTLTPGNTYYWRVRAIDERALDSGWTDPFHFIVEPPTGTCPPEWREDFERYPIGGAPEGWMLRKELGRPSFRVVTSWARSGW